MPGNVACPIVPLGPQGQEAAGWSIHKILLAISIFLVTKGTAPGRQQITRTELAFSVYRKASKVKNTGLTHREAILCTGGTGKS